MFIDRLFDHKFFNHQSDYMKWRKQNDQANHRSINCNKEHQSDNGNLFLTEITRLIVLEHTSSNKVTELLLFMLYLFKSCNGIVQGWW